MPNTTIKWTFSILSLTMLFIIPAALAPFLGNAASERGFLGDTRASTDGFTHAENVHISPATPFADYTIRVNLNATFTYEACQADGDDVRFFDLSGNSLAFWVEKWNVAGNTIIWVKIPAAGTSQIVMAYGNNSLAAASNGAATFPFFDDFTGPSIDSAKWATGNTVYGSISLNTATDMVTVQSTTPSNCRMSTFEGLHDGYATGSAYGTYLSRGIFTANGNANTLNGTTGTAYAESSKQTTAHDYNLTWSTKEYQFASTNLSRFSLDNDTWIAAHTSNLPQSAVPINFFARGMYYGGGENHGAWLVSKLSWYPDGTSGYAMRTLNKVHYDYQVEAGADPCYITVDWVCVRRIPVIESATWLSDVPASTGPGILSFSHVEQVNISPATPAADYTIRLDLTASFDYAACQADGDDVRFFDNADVPLSFWTEKWTNGGDSILWVKIPAAGTTSIKMAYGNATIGADSNGEATFPLFDDFSGANINASKWEAEDDAYSSVTVVSGKAHIRSLAIDPSSSLTWMGFSDVTLNHGVPNGLTWESDVINVNGDLATREADIYSVTSLKKNQTWILLDYCWIDGSNVRFSENETVVATHTTNVPDVPMPVFFMARSNQYGPGYNFAGLIRSNVSFSTGHAIRANAYIQHDMRGTYPTMEPVVDVDWVFVRKCIAIEPIATIANDPFCYLAVENFESYAAGDDIEGKSGPLGDWATWLSAGCYSRVYNDSGNLVLDTMDNSASGAASAKVSFDVSGAINGANIVTWQQSIISAAAYNVILFEGSSMCVQVQFSGGNQVRYYAPDHSGLVNTGLTFGTGWETYDVLLYSTSQFKLRQFKGGSWSNWVGPFDLRTHWSSSGAVCSAWDIDGCTPLLPRVLMDNVGVTWLCSDNSSDNTPPEIAISGFGGSSIEQGDAAYLNWTLTDAHPATYALYLNGAAIRSGSYIAGSRIGVQIDSSILGQLNYTMVAQDAFGNVQRNEKLITVVSRTDGGIFLYVGVNLINRNGTHQVILMLNMSHWAVLYLKVVLSVTSTSQLLPGPLPAGLVIALPVVFNMNITNSSALRNGFIRVYYDQALIANQVNEANLAVLRWDEATSAWVTSTAGFSRSRNYIDIGLSANGLHVIASTPKQNYDPILIIVLIGITGGIVSAAGYSYARKKATKVGTVRRTVTLKPLVGTPTTPRDVPFEGNGSLAPGTGDVVAMNGLVESFDELTNAPNEPILKVALRVAAEARAVHVVSRCVVHKGPISGSVYTCKHCGASYCRTCMNNLAEIDEPCWACKQRLSR